MEFQLLIKCKMQKNKALFALKFSDVLYVIIINVEMPTTVSISTFKSRVENLQQLLVYHIYEQLKFHAQLS